MVVLFAKGAVDETSKIYGPIFARFVAEAALKFEAEKLKEKPPQNINSNSLEDVSKYILANLTKYPRGYCALIYGVGKAESKLEGSMASGAKRSAWSAMKSMLEASGLVNSLIGTTESTFEALVKFTDIAKPLKTSITSRAIRGKNNDLTLIVPECPYKDGCKALFKEGVTRGVGGMECMCLIADTAAVGLITKKRLDYKVEEFDKPECKGRIYEV
jgi:hypothetical protein